MRQSVGAPMNMKCILQIWKSIATSKKMVGIKRETRAYADISEVDGFLTLYIIIIITM